jgi:hypothetical protein
VNLSTVIEIVEALSEVKQVMFGSALLGEDTVVEEFPAVYIAPLREVGAEPIEISNYLQEVDQMFEVVMVCSYAQFSAAREALVMSLIGKELIPGSLSACRFVEGMQVEGTGTLMYWRDIFAIRKQRRAQ